MDTIEKIVVLTYEATAAVDRGEWPEVQNLMAARGQEIVRLTGERPTVSDEMRQRLTEADAVLDAALERARAQFGAEMARQLTTRRGLGAYGASSPQTGYDFNS